MALKRISPEQYFAEENAREERAQYFDGEVVMMAGTGNAHELINFDMAGCFTDYVRQGGECQPYTSGNTRVPAGPTYVYPDLVVACDPVFEPHPKRLLLNPILIVEILSPSTENFDRNRKSWHYRDIATLREYLLVHTNEPLIEVFRRVEDGWLWMNVQGEDSVLRLTSLGFDLKFADVYRTRTKQGWPPDA